MNKTPQNLFLVTSGIKNIIKGAATGGLHGATIAAAKSFAPQLIKIAAIIIMVIILLSVIIISTLPSVLFGWATLPDAGLQARKSYAESMEDCYARVWGYRQEVIGEIKEDNSSPGDTVDLTDDQEGINIYWIIAIDGVRHRQDVYNINEANIKDLIRKSLESDVKRSGGRNVDISVTSLDPEKLMDKLGYSNEQKNWARLLYNTTASSQNISESDPDYISGEGADYSDVTFTDGSTTVVYYNQFDSRWKDILYGSKGTIGKEGCGPAALAMVVSTLTDTTVTPVDVAEWSAANGHRCVGSGSYHSLIPNGAKHYGRAATRCCTI